MGENPRQKSWSAMKSSQRDQRDHCLMWLFAGYLQFNENFLTFCLYRSVNMNGIVPTASPSNSMHFWQPMKSYWKIGCVKKLVLNFITELYESRINQSINLLLIIVCLFVCLFWGRGGSLIWKCFSAGNILWLNYLIDLIKTLAHPSLPLGGECLSETVAKNKGIVQGYFF